MLPSPVTETDILPIRPDAPGAHELLTPDARTVVSRADVQRYGRLLQQYDYTPYLTVVQVLEQYRRVKTEMGHMAAGRGLQTVRCRIGFLE